MPTASRVRNPQALALLGQQLRRTRLAAGLPQSRVGGMRQATVSRIENGLDVNLDTFISCSAALGLELVLVTPGQASIIRQQQDPKHRPHRTPPPGPPALDLLEELDFLRDPE
ncbi:MAG: helix-turn-helix transcriptional regulator [Lautropia sp.]|nr:helix-turn-helix transcriptional regulator [Lautropia sp.]